MPGPANDLCAWGASSPASRHGSGTRCGYPRDADVDWLHNSNAHLQALPARRPLPCRRSRPASRPAARDARPKLSACGTGRAWAWPAGMTAAAGGAPPRSPGCAVHRIDSDERMQQRRDRGERDRVAEEEHGGDQHEGDGDHLVEPLRAQPQSPSRAEPGSGSPRGGSGGSASAIAPRRAEPSSRATADRDDDQAFRLVQDHGLQGGEGERADGKAPPRPTKPPRIPMIAPPPEAAWCDGVGEVRYSSASGMTLQAT